MTMSRTVFSVALAALLAVTQSKTSLPLNQIKLPPGFSVSLYATGVRNARSMTLGTGGNVFVGTMDAGDVYAIADRDKDGRADDVIRIASGLLMPNGVAFRDRSLYVAEVNRVSRYDNIESNLKSPPKPSIVYGSLPSERHHGWRFIAFGPDGWLYVPVGAPCNVCKVSDPYASINR